MINGTTALGMEAKYGSIDKSKKAHLIIYYKCPLDDHNNFLSSQTFRDGKVFINAVLN
jgi:imidazolonepropionase-like amidohydrolase